MNKLIFQQLILALILAISVRPACSAVQPLADIRQAAMDFVLHRLGKQDADIKISAGRLDRRLRFPRCELPLEAFSPHNIKTAGNTTIGVRCNGGKPWSIYVPVLIQVYSEVAVAAHGMPANSNLTRTDIRMVKMDISRTAGGYITDTTPIVGKQLTRPVQYGQPLTRHMLKAPVAVRRGDKVQLLSKSSTCQVSMEGESLMNAAVGDRIRVRNLRSKRIIEGKLMKDGTVFVN